eukprot:365650-Chlamydomonas_euryale.AAC.21
MSVDALSAPEAWGRPRGPGLDDRLVRRGCGGRCAEGGTRVNRWRGVRTRDPHRGRHPVETPTLPVTLCLTNSARYAATLTRNPFTPHKTHIQQHVRSTLRHTGQPRPTPLPGNHT